MKRAMLVILAALGLIAGVANAEVYRWVDKTGKVHYSDVPPPEEANAKVRKFTDNKVEVDKLPYEVRKAAEASPLVFYAAPDYKDATDSARALLKRRKLPFTERTVKTTDDIKDLIARNGKAPKVPALGVGNKLVEGFDESSWNTALDAAGYPKQ